MKRILRSFALFFIFSIHISRLTAQSADSQDSMAIVDFYNANTNPLINGVTYPIEWTDHTNWLTAAPLSTWHGITVDRVTGKVIGLNLNNNGLLFPVFPPSFANLTHLTDLQLANDFFVGPIPDVISTLTELTTLNLNRNQFTGSIPPSFANLTKLHRLDLGLLFQLTPENFPPFLTSLTNLDTLVLNYMGLTGELPEDIGNLKNLLYLDLAHNNLTGAVPASIGNCWHLAFFWINDNNLSGTFPASFLALSNIRNTAMNFLCTSNHYNFDALEQLPNFSWLQTKNTIQKNLLITSKSDSLSVTAGGTLSEDTFYLYRDGYLNKIQVGDSVFKVTNTGKYSYAIHNGFCGSLSTLYSDTAFVKANIPNIAETASQNISGFAPVDVNVGLDKLASLQPSGTANSLQGNTTVAVTIDSSVQLFHQQPYVQRHYDIQPISNPSTAEANVTLFFTQADFDNFNAYITANNLQIPLLPSGGIDNGNVRIIQQHGTFSGSSDPGNYNGTSILITPVVTWNARDNWWEVTFPVTGFSGFFVSTMNIALPLTLLDFTAKLNNNAVDLTWSTTNETNTKSFVVEKDEGSGFHSVGNVEALSIPGEHRYNFRDVTVATGIILYRLKMIDIDGNFRYSNIVSIRDNRKIENAIVYPNPVIATGTVMVAASIKSKYFISIRDNSGREVKQMNGQLNVGNNKLLIDVARWPAGVYFIDLQTDHNTGVYHLKLIKQ